MKDALFTLGLRKSWIYWLMKLKKSWGIIVPVHLNPETSIIFGVGFFFCVDVISIRFFPDSGDGLPDCSRLTLYYQEQESGNLFC